MKAMKPHSAVIRWAGEELGWLAVAAIRQLGLENDEVEVVQSGSVFEGGTLITEPIRHTGLRHTRQNQAHPPSTRRPLSARFCSACNWQASMAMQCAQGLLKPRKKSSNKTGHAHKVISTYPKNTMSL